VGWLIGMDGRSALASGGNQLTAATVVIQHTTIRTSLPGMEQAAAGLDPADCR